MLGIDAEVEDPPAELHSCTKSQGKDEKGAMAGTSVEPSKITHGESTLDLSAAPTWRQRDKKTTRRIEKEDG